jgi:uridine kinase
VAGASGSGKTCIAQLIEEKLGAGVRVVSISSDSYYKGVPPGISASEHNWDHPDALDMGLLARHLDDLHNARWREPR